MPCSEVEILRLIPAEGLEVQYPYLSKTGVQTLQGQKNMITRSNSKVISWHLSLSRTESSLERCVLVEGVGDA